MIAIDHAYDSHVVNGVLEGDYGKRDLTPLSNGYPSGEHLACATISGASKYSSFENLTVKKFCGYAMQSGISPITGGEHSINSNIYKWIKGSINNRGQLDSSVSNKYTCDYVDLSVFESVNTLRSGKYLGYQYNPEGNSWIVEYHFYDSSKNYISTIVGHQYRDFKKTSNAKYLRCTYSTDNSSALSGIMIMHNYFPRNCQFKNISFEDTRTCSLAPFQGNNILIDNCTFTRCATNITPVAIDFEDGWHNMQDYCIQN